MAIPKHEDIRVPALRLLSENESLKLNEFELPLAQFFCLSEQDLLQEYESGNGKIFYDRVSWALSYMNMAGLVKKPKRAVYQISDAGVKQLKIPNSINAFIATQIENREPEKRSKRQGIEKVSTSLTPQEELYDSFSKIRASVYNEVIDVVLSKTPREFEKLVVMLLQHMGYGGGVKSSGEVT
ncbi:MAG: hypothetical protein COB30_011765 [Ectothiorhodospiraceae bacterium]|nr:hypothetical protein [Ectothiorhodospiraceae bacterium]